MKRFFAAFSVFAAVTLPAQVPAQEAVQRSSSPSGMRVPGEGAPRAPAERGSAAPAAAAAPAVEGNAMTAASPAKGGVKIQGNTRIDARGRDLNAITTGKDSKAGNAVGTIGDR